MDDRLVQRSLLVAVREARYQSRPPPERGVVTMFVVALVAAMLALGGLVIDGGALLAAKRRAINEAEGAARAGAQELSEPALREGRLVLDPDAARSAAVAYLTEAGHEGTVAVDDDQVSVTVTITADLAILTMIDPTVTGSGLARAVRGVRSADEP